MQAHTPHRLIALTRSKLSAVSSAASVGGAWMPALLKAMSSRPKVATVVVDHGGDVVFGGDVAGDGECLVAGGGEVVRGAAEGVRVDVGEGDSGPGLGEGLRGGQSHAGARAGNQGDLVGEVVAGVHGVCLTAGSGRVQSRGSMVSWKESPGFGYEVQAGVDPADDHDAGAGDPLAIVAVEDREVVGGRPVAEVADLVGGLALTVASGRGSCRASPGRTGRAYPV